MNNYQKYNIILTNILCTKTQKKLLQKSIIINKLHVLAGPYRPNRFYLAHPFVFNSIIGQFPNVKYQRQGKREKETVSLYANYKNLTMPYEFISRFISVIMPSIIDMRSIKGIKRLRFASSFMMRLRYRFGVNFPDCDELIVDEMHDTKRGVFLPLSIAVNFNSSMGYSQLEDIIRMFRFPVSFYRWWPYPAIDDTEVIRYGALDDYY
jgi:hypothetical protein